MPKNTRTRRTLDPQYDRRKALEAMHDQNLNVMGLAELAGVDHKTVRRILTGSTRGRIASWQKIAKALGIPLQNLRLIGAS